ncbi:hypothetical protein [Myceligenerans crystallogenes]
MPGPGDVVVDRYRLDSHLRTDLADAAAFEAYDQVLDRAVRLTLVAGARAAEVADAARRAALVTGRRISRVLDVGAAEAGTYVVTEPYPGETLTAIVSQGLVDEQQARAIAGEVATALAAADERGVHHGVVRPDAVRVERDRVVLTGLGLDAGVVGDDVVGPDPAAADARSVLALLYYAMTARWPGVELDAGWITKDTIIPLPARRDDAGAVTPLSTLVPHIDPAIDTLVTETFDPEAAERAPRTPGDVVAALRRWGEVSVLASLPAFVQQDPESTGPQAGPPAPPVRRPVVTGRIARAEEAPVMSSVPPEGVPLGQPAHPPVPPPPPGFQPRSQQQTAQQTAYQQPPQYAPQGYQQQYPPQSYDPQYQAQPQYAAQQGYPQQPQYYDQNAGFATQPAPRRGGVNPTPIVLGVVAVAVIAGLVWAISAVLSPNERPVDVVGADTSASSAGEESSGDGDSSAPKQSATPATEARPVITTSELVSPEGPAPTSEEDHPEAAALVFDADPTTFWYTSTYTDPSFGGTKAGSGVALTLQAEAAVSTIDLATNSEGGNIQIRATTPDDPAGGTVLAEGPVKQGTTTFTLEEPVVGKSFVVWITALPESAPLEGQPELKYRLELNEVTLS